MFFIPWKTPLSKASLPPASDPLYPIWPYAGLPRATHWTQPRALGEPDEAPGGADCSPVAPALLVGFRCAAHNASTPSHRLSS